MDGARETPVEELPPARPRLDLPRARVALALVIAVVSDLLSVWLTFAPPAQWTLDLLTALALFAVIGWRWAFLPGLIFEAIPGLSMFPFWTVVVATLGFAGSVRPKLN